MSQPDSPSAAAARPDLQAKDRDLKRMKAIALGALLVCLALLLLSHLMGRKGGWAWLGAFAEAGAVGALADWFAVTALFRHPLGIPIPHTAIIPRNRTRIAESLATFVRDKFLDKNVLLQRLAEWNPAQRLGAALGQPEQLEQVSLWLRNWLATSLNALDKPTLARIEAELLAFVRQQLKEWHAAPLAAQLLQALASNSDHQRLLNTALHKVAEWVGTPAIRGMIAEKMVATARREYPKMVWLTDKLDYTQSIAESLAERLAQALVDEVQAVLAEPDHPLRQHYAAEVARWAQRLQHDTDLQQRVEDFKNQFLDHPDLRMQVLQLWQKLRHWLQDDLQAENSSIHRWLMRQGLVFGRRLQREPQWQNAFNQQVQIVAWHLADHLRTIAPAHIRQTMLAWHDDDLVREIERHVGRDLQFIRLNGTLIGGLMGLVLYALQHFLA
ncbi:MAG: DUF445 domain-containing protein [Brachymonas sp.]|nr:DUF445 domain-containing protein [Brachymonas sp.]